MGKSLEENKCHKPWERIFPKRIFVPLFVNFHLLKGCFGATTEKDKGENFEKNERGK
ncbi:MAG: hypothetical protein Ct9H300mP21_09650 [Pseudomonadota bacterium]|nr:MAG: hypothetical protein Ct9H300mP21_09650 [Pseudomonadota bacterium]